ncbi:flippase [Natrinema salifodinae]|uniref:Membrane protein involved in the export of O-antigen and teichoic acid n=1 Tax=Natrinema salifodinae TaxID=1202768 RepID=A0A1I0M0P4_9EURY|nr:flippase [Natrinema salifodinae]SEV81149.1 Membrane protein involved in the export of O-antigen and teichoic acid [Natrinema salifodinae]
MSRDILRGIVSIAGSNVAVMVLAFPLTPILVRFLGSAQYGDYAFMLSFLSVAWVFVNGGVFDGMRKYIAEEREMANWQEYVFGFYFRVALVFAVPSALVIGLAAYVGVIEFALDATFRTYFYLIGVLIVARQLRAVGRSVLMGLGDEHLSEPLLILEKFFFWPVALGLVYTGLGVSGVLVGHIVAVLLSATTAFVILSRRVSIAALFRRTPPDFPRRTLVSFNNRTIVLMFLLNALLYTDILLLHPIAGSEQAGYYQAAIVITDFLWLVPFAVQLTLLHSSSELWSNGRRERINEVSALATRYVFLVTMLFCVGIAVLADSFVPLYYGGEFEAAIRPLQFLLIGVVGFAVARPIFAIGQGKGTLRTLIYATGAAVAFNLVLNLLLIPRYGTNGAAVATSIGYGSMLIFHVWSARRLGFDPLGDFRFGRILATTVVTGVVIYPLDAVIGSPVVSLLLVPPVGLVIFLLTAVTVGAIDDDDIIYMLERSPERVQRMIP